MKNFFIRITELFTTVSLSSFLIYFLFKFIIGSPEDLKQVHTDLKSVTKSMDTIKTSVDSLNQTNQFMLERMMVIEERQVTHNQKLDETDELIKKSQYELVELRKLYGKLIQPVYYQKIPLETDSIILERYKEIK